MPVDEQGIQRQAVAALRMLYPEGRGHGVTVRAIPNGGLRGGKRNKRGALIEAAIMKGTGVESGEPDLLLTVWGRVFHVELKSESGALRPNQKRRIAHLVACGNPVWVLRDSRHVVELVGELCRRTALGLPWPEPKVYKTPPTRTHNGEPLKIQLRDQKPKPGW